MKKHENFYFNILIWKIYLKASEMNPEYRKDFQGSSESYEWSGLRRNLKFWFFFKIFSIISGRVLRITSAWSDIKHGSPKFQRLENSAEHSALVRKLRFWHFPDWLGIQDSIMRNKIETVINLKIFFDEKLKDLEVTFD